MTTATADKPAAQKKRKTSTKSTTRSKTKASGPQVSQDPVEFERQLRSGEIDPYDSEASVWMRSEDSIPGAYPPILYIGPRASIDIALKLGRQIRKDEAKLLVQIDGKKRFCDLGLKTGEEIEFQPVKYVPFLSREMIRDIEAGKDLTEAELYFGGCFYGNGDGTTTLAISGSIFYYDFREKKYHEVKDSGLIIMSKKKLKETRRRNWGVPLDFVHQVEQQVEQRKDRSHRRHLAANELSDSVVNLRQRGNRQGKKFGSLPPESLLKLGRVKKHCKVREAQTKNGG